MLRIVRTTSSHPDFQLLVAQLEKELRDRYGAIQNLYEPHNKVADIDTVVIAYSDDKPAGCGCFKVYDAHTIEIKRMFVDGHNRQKGIAQKVLQELETWACELGYTHAVLETGLRQPESILLYEKAGYSKIPNYEPYMDMVESLCFGKQL